MKELLEVKALNSCIFDVDFTNVVDEHELGTKEDVNRAVKVVLIDTFYFMRGIGALAIWSNMYLISRI